MKRKKKFQFVFYWTGFWFERINKETSIGYIYDWAIGLGFVEIRRWRKPIYE